MQFWTDKIRFTEDDYVWTVFKTFFPETGRDYVSHSDGFNSYPDTLIFERLTNNEFDLPPSWVVC